jgi:hypothetical protein
MMQGDWSQGSPSHWAGTNPDFTTIWRTDGGVRHLKRGQVSGLVTFVDLMTVFKLELLTFLVLETSLK